MRCSISSAVLSSSDHSVYAQVKRPTKSDRNVWSALSVISWWIVYELWITSCGGSRHRYDFFGQLFLAEQSLFALMGKALGVASLCGLSLEILHICQWHPHCNNSHHLISRLCQGAVLLGFCISAWPIDTTQLNLSANWPLTFLPSVIGVSIGSGLFEELIFRGLCLPACYFILRGFNLFSSWALPGSIFMSALLFAFAHEHDLLNAFSNPCDLGSNVLWSAFLYRTSWGLVLGTIVWRWGLGSAITIHVIHNAVVMTRIMASL